MTPFSVYYLLLYILLSSPILAFPHARGSSGSGVNLPSQDIQRQKQTETKPPAAATPLHGGAQTGVVKLEPIYGPYGSLNLFTVPVKIGSAELRMVLDTGSNRVIVAAPEAAKAVSEVTVTPYKPSSGAESREEKFEISYHGGTKVSGKISLDVVQIGSYMILKQPVSVGTEVTGSFPADGIFGLGMSNDSGGWFGWVMSIISGRKEPSSPSPSFMTNIARQLQAEPLFSLEIQDPKTATIQFGGSNSSKYTGEMDYVDVKPNGRWDVSFPGITTITDGKTHDAPHRDITIDSGESRVRLEPPLAKAYMSQVPDHVFDPSSGAFAYPCKTALPDLVLRLDTSATVTIKGRDLFFQRADFVGKYCYSAIGVEDGGNTLGLPFFKSYYTIFEAGEDPRIGFAPYRVEANRNQITVGVLALQGAFSEHLQLLRRAAAILRSDGHDGSDWTFLEVRTPAELARCDALILPGGESTTMSLVASRSGLLESLRDFVKVSRKPTWGTCAGLILLAESANRIKKGGQDLIGGLDIRIDRNHFGRQTESFETDLTLPFLSEGTEDSPNDGDEPFRGVFIRAPVVEKILPRRNGMQIEEAAGAETVVAPAKAPEKGVAQHYLNAEVEVMATLPEARSDVRKERIPAKETRGKGDIVAVLQGNCFGTSFHPELTNDARIHAWWLRKVEEAVAERHQ